MTESMSESKKIGGYDAWKVTGAVDTLKRAEEIKADSKFLKVVLVEMDKESDKLEKTANLLSKTKQRLDKTFKEKKQ